MDWLIDKLGMFFFGIPPYKQFEKNKEYFKRVGKVIEQNRDSSFVDDKEFTVRVLQELDSIVEDRHFGRHFGRWRTLIDIFKLLMQFVLIFIVYISWVYVFTVLNLLISF